MVAWRKQEKALKEKGVEKKHRPSMLAEDPNYPNKKILALKLLSDFMQLFPDLRIRAVAADAYYGTRDFMDNAAKITKQKQVISQIKKTQLINVNGRNSAVDQFFKNFQGKTEESLVRGCEKKITYRSGRFKIKSHDKKYYIIALKYDRDFVVIDSDNNSYDLNISSETKCLLLQVITKAQHTVASLKKIINVK